LASRSVLSGMACPPRRREQAVRSRLATAPPDRGPAREASEASFLCAATGGRTSGTTRKQMQSLRRLLSLRRAARLTLRREEGLGASHAASPSWSERLRRASCPAFSSAQPQALSNSRYTAAQPFARADPLRQVSPAAQSPLPCCTGRPGRLASTVGSAQTLGLRTKARAATPERFVTVVNSAFPRWLHRDRATRTTKCRSLRAPSPCSENHEMQPLPTE
jgi:hypothetical protein